MTPEQQRIAIAEACGLTIVSDGIMHHLTPCGKKTEREPEGCLLKECPDYLHSLDAMHTAEKTLKAEQFPAYLDMLDVACGGELELSAMVDGVDVVFGFVHATAAQKAEAFLKTLGLWNYES